MYLVRSLVLLLLLCLPSAKAIAQDYPSRPITMIVPFSAGGPGDVIARILGTAMQAVDRASSMRAFRMDDRKQRLFIDRAIEPGAQIFGWEVANAAALNSLAARLEAAAVAVKREPASLADQRCVTEVISFADPGGNRLEAFHGAQVADTVFKPGRDVSGFRTGPQGMGHTL